MQNGIQQQILALDFLRIANQFELFENDDTSVILSSDVDGPVHKSIQESLMRLIEVFRGQFAS